MSTYLDILTSAIIVRGIERITIICIAAFISYLGYKLFIKGVESQEAKLVGEGAAFKLSISGTGPGLFFLTFGAIILIFSVSTKLDIKVLKQHVELSQKVERQAQENDNKAPNPFSISYLS